MGMTQCQKSTRGKFQWEMNAKRRLKLVQHQRLLLFLRWYLYEIIFVFVGGLRDEVLWFSSFPFSQLSFSLLTALGCFFWFSLSSLSFTRVLDNEISSNKFSETLTYEFTSVGNGGIRPPCLTARLWAAICKLEMETKRSYRIKRTPRHQPLLKWKPAVGWLTIQTGHDTTSCVYNPQWREMSNSWRVWKLLQLGKVLCIHT